ncbi:hypothetical protein ACJIZ3_004291 [Penstemon smallii]|uniref:F-box/kelch-repeat protein SKIP25 n=1 Tax=Penstemon smallii TaxID=265156 RepID=A0ABD3S1N3_9LAMI
MNRNTTPSSSSTTTLQLDHRTPTPTAKRQTLLSDLAADQNLLPGLPDHIAQLCLSHVPPSTIYSVSHSWRRLIYSPFYPPFLSLYALFLSTDTDNNTGSNSVNFHSFDPISRKWQPLPPPPTDPPIRFIFRHPSYISRKLPIQSVAAAGKLVLLAATTEEFLPALSRPLVFDPLLKEWMYGPPFHAPRRWCAAGALSGVVYVASGIGSHYNNDVARSVEKWDPSRLDRAKQPRDWEKIREMKDGKFSRDAIDAVGWRGRLCVVNVKGDFAKEGLIYDVGKDEWEEMPEGMLAGWKGPAAAMVEEEEDIYMVDESKGSLKKYDHVRDTWVVVVKYHEMLKGAQQVVAGGGRVCVLSADGVSIVVVNVAGLDPGRVWVVDAPPGFQGVAIHILPRLSKVEDIASK